MSENTPLTTLHDVFDKAIERGWTPPLSPAHLFSDGDGIMYNCSPLEQRALIFSHDFAKALWGEEYLELVVDNTELMSDHDTVFSQPAWKSHLQQMVIADDPIAYLGEHI